MSAWWSAQVVAKDNQRIVIELRAIHPDAGAFPTDKKFALRLIYDEAYGFAPGLVRQRLGIRRVLTTRQRTSWLT